ncbi:hypothetical protein [Wolbachia endosymbiont (group A) of Udea olivalis]|uniref:hypothetical protein n=1 Tax=Wolbachia endosymbiont (group A) of Udea olivalis TaxID=3066183 RepID=UPI00333EB4B0
MTIAKEVVYALHQRLKDLSVNATPDQLAYLAKSLESIAGQSTVLDIVQMTDAKLKELLDSSTSHLNKLDSSKNNALAAISELEGKSLKKIDEKGTTNLSLLDTRKNANIAAINSTGADQLSTLKGLVKNFEVINDVPSGSSIIKEIKKRNMVESGSLPFLFGVLSRNNDYNWGSGHFTTELGKWYIDTSYTNNMFSLIVGCHNYSTNYVSFYKPPSIYFIQGKNGTFIYRELYSRYTASSNEYSYPYALLGVIFVKNTASSNITRTLNFVGSASWSSQYEGAGAFVGTPNNTNTNKGQISSISWQNIYNLGSSSSGFSSSGGVVIPSNKTVAILFYTSPYYYTSSNNYYTQFMQWGVYNFRSNFLTTGLEIDVERTLKAWQCPGLERTDQIWQ